MYFSQYIGLDIEAVLLSTPNICFGWEIRKIFFLVRTLNLRRAIKGKKMCVILC